MLLHRIYSRMVSVCLMSVLRLFVFLLDFHKDGSLLMPVFYLQQPVP